ncbi:MULTISPECIES: xanthine dehydrogenase accessory protein XdhC [Roseobacteraceae]|jgi:xanthine dehydrogenase accessory factor|uniref:XdhC Rossmann domain protein n=1 Tax=Pseudosulfitobacter pseudonitzschiae TaxID=1402135 RepID=A0A221K6F4_9RHOB|nr:MULTISPECIES: xanthine dehydrogenase accessory protein XdhC [Roseobacteraceae]ASM74581.1 XdhC Rossmann domain protein [Pseudosulfitobacter pseudonitzschiae]
MTTLATFLSTHASVIRVALTRVRGSSPRNAGTEMFVAQGGLFGTIGGGQLEHLAIERARAMLVQGDLNTTMDVPLGPEIGQCCGGRVELALARLRQADRHTALVRAQAAQDAQPSVYVMGAGHVGRALADLFQHLPVNCVLVDTRPEELALCRAGVDTKMSVIPEAEIATAPAGSAFVVLTHDHGLDFLLASAALERGDAVYVGMIGSATKRVKFRNWLRDHCDGQSIEDLNCPIGASGSRDKRPSVIAAFVVAEVMAELTSETVAAVPKGEKGAPRKGEQTDRTGRTA